MSGPKRDAYAEITARIVEALEAGVVPWVKPWRSLGVAGVLRNATSGRPYHGINVWLLGMEAYADPRWCTFKQAKALGGSVRRGEHGTKIVFWRFIEKGAGVDDAGEATKAKRFPMLRTYTVFNVEQCDDLQLDGADDVEQPAPVDLDADLQRFVDATGANIQHRGGRACYAPDLDQITLPKPETFKDAGAYHATALHELTHWTGHALRCDRSAGMQARFKTQAYAAEELVAELGSAFLCQRFQVDGTLQHAEYIATWVRMFRDDKRAIFAASSRAKKAARWMFEATGWAEEVDAGEQVEAAADG